MVDHAPIVRVLLIEDNPGDHRLVQEGLKSCRFLVELRCVDNGEEALTLLSDPAYKPDLVIVDLNIPRIDGAQVMRFIKYTEPRLRAVPAIVLSSFPHADPEIRSSIPADAFFTKPSSIDNYFAVIREICRTWLEPLVHVG